MLAGTVRLMNFLRVVIFSNVMRMNLKVILVFVEGLVGVLLDTHPNPKIINSNLLFLFNFVRYYLLMNSVID